MLTSMGIIIIFGLLGSFLFKKIKLPGLIGMIIAGIIIGPSVCNLLGDSILMLSPDLRKLALVVILTRAGLSLKIDDLKKVGRPALLLCFVPASVEILAVTFVAPLFLGINHIDAAIMGCVLAAVSPAVVVPRMIKMMEEGYGKKNNIPQMIMAGASVDDIYVIVLFTSLTTLAVSGQFNATQILDVPISIVGGILLGIAVGLVLLFLFKYLKTRASVKLLIVLSVSLLVLEIETLLQDYVAISALLAIMSMGIVIKQKNPNLAEELSQKYNKLWVAAEIILFVLVGASVNLLYVKVAGLVSIAIVVIGLCVRMIGVWLSVVGTKLDKKERLFSMVAYTPKATVQAAIGGIPLAMGLASGEAILTIAVLAILITAPFGAIFIDKMYKKIK